MANSSAARSCGLAPQRRDRRMRGASSSVDRSVLPSGVAPSRLTNRDVCAWFEKNTLLLRLPNNIVSGGEKKKSRGGDVAAPAQGENPRRSFFLFPGAPRSRCPADTVHPLSIFVWNRREMLEAARKEVEAANGLNRELGTVRPDMAEEVHR